MIDITKKVEMLQGVNKPLQLSIEEKVRHPSFRHVELFAGAGGLAIGCQSAGLPDAHLFEADEFCYKTLAANMSKRRGALGGVVTHSKVEDIEWNGYADQVEVISGGAPCQPFSLGGRHLAWRDGRNLFPEVFRAVRYLNPRALFLENVKGLMRADFAPYFEYILAQARDPSLGPKDRDETWEDHFARLRKHQSTRKHRPEFHVFWDVFNAADYGVPQIRHRIFIVAVASDLPPYEPPKKTHSKSALVLAQQGKEYWDQRGIKKPVDVSMSRIKLEEGDLTPWVTVRDAISNLPTPAKCEESASMNHWKIDGARSYEGHSGSRLDWPAKTIKAGVHGVPGGENTVVTDNGKLRYFTLREAARIQTFPDDHVFAGARSHVTRQIGNAVPCKLARAVALPLTHVLATAEPRRKVNDEQL